MRFVQFAHDSSALLSLSKHEANLFDLWRQADYDNQPGQGVFEIFRFHDDLYEKLGEESGHHFNLQVRVEKNSERITNGFALMFHVHLTGSSDFFHTTAHTHTIGRLGV